MQSVRMDLQFMYRAIELAENGEGHVNPNPLVGAVIVKENRIIGEGFHQYPGGPHAEINALSSCLETPKGASLYVTLEPCCHYGRTPPCTEAIIQSGISTVYIGSRDPNPLVAGKGAAVLRDAGITIKENILKEECDALNQVFFHYITTERPYIAVKYAMTADGKTATVTGASKWITGEEARKHVHLLRRKYTGILAGIGTVLKDDPMLNCRIEDPRNPVRIICDSKLKIPLNSRICQTAREIPTIIACKAGEPEKQSLLEDLGITVLTLPAADGKVDLSALMQELGKRQIDSILSEGGGTLHYSLLKAGLVSKVYAYVAPKIFGGKDGFCPVGGAGVQLPEQAYSLSEPKISVFGSDTLLEFNISGGM